MKIAAGSLQEQASGLSQVVSVFKLDNSPLNYVPPPLHTAALKPRLAPMQPHPAANRPLPRRNASSWRVQAPRPPVATEKRFEDHQMTIGPGFPLDFSPKVFPYLADKQM